MTLKKIDELIKHYKDQQGKGQSINEIEILVDTIIALEELKNLK